MTQSSMRASGCLLPQAALRRCNRGFTLIELLVAMTIVAILLTLAYSSYQDSIVKSRRAAATTCLQQNAQFMERYYTTQMTYVGAPAPTACGNDVSDHYALSYSVTPAAGADVFTIQAVPTGNQLAKDTRCGTLTISQTGARTTESGTASVDDCW